MPMKQLKPGVAPRGARRVLNFGPPNSFKSTSLLTWPRQSLYKGQFGEGYCHVISMPGEGGYDTLPIDIEDFKVYAWEEGDIATQSPTQTVEEVEDLTWRIMAGEYGPVTSLALDGFHKYYDVVADSITAGKFSRGEQFEARMYAQIHRKAQFYLRRVLHSKIPYVVVTTWNAPEADKKGDQKGPSHDFPSLPGMMSKLILGEIPTVVFSGVMEAKPGEKRQRGYWMLKPDDEVWGANVKIDPRMVEKLPTRIVQSWAKLDEVIKGALEKKEPA